jgi:glycosyltransferase involved in cell wall biosynthesis
MADIFLLLSTAEGFPRVVNEALLHSLPVIVTPVGGIPDELVDGEQVLFVPTRSPKATAEAIVRLANDAQLRKRMIRQGYSWGIEQMREPAWHQHARLLGLL